MGTSTTATRAHASVIAATGFAYPTDVVAVSYTHLTLPTKRIV